MASCAAGTRRPVPWLALCVALGVALRVHHFLLCPSVWHDEAALILNVLGKGFGELIGPLFFAEAAPPLFLLTERAISLVLGDSVWALRLLPFLASCASLGLVALAARRLLPAGAAPWAVFLVACSDKLLWHSIEAKPYALDVLAAAGLLALYAGMRSWPLTRQVLVFAALAPVIIWMCFPGCFLYGALLVVLLPSVLRERRLGPWLSYGMLVLAVFGSFLLLLGPIHAQRHANMDACWVKCFPNWGRPWMVPVWMVASTLDVVRYCFHPTGHGLAVVAAVGGVVLWRGGQRRLVALLTLPLLLALVAACLHAYPYGGARVEVYVAPALALLVAAGIVPTWQWLRARHRLAGLVLAFLLLDPLALALYRAVCPWLRADSSAAADFVLANRRADDLVSGNAWQDAYYFRRADGVFDPALDQAVQRTRDRIWIIWTEFPPRKDDQPIRARLQGKGRIVARRDFAGGCSVFLCKPGVPSNP